MSYKYDVILYMSMFCLEIDVLHSRLHVAKVMAGVNASFFKRFLFNMALRKKLDAIKRLGSQSADQPAIHHVLDL